MEEHGKQQTFIYTIRSHLLRILAGLDNLDNGSVTEETPIAIQKMSCYASITRLVGTRQKPRVHFGSVADTANTIAFFSLFRFAPGHEQSQEIL